MHVFETTHSRNSIILIIIRQTERSAVWFSLRLGMSGYGFLWLICPRGCDNSKRQEGPEVRYVKAPSLLYCICTFITTRGVACLWLSLHWDGLHHSHPNWMEGAPEFLPCLSTRTHPQGSHLRRQVSHGSKRPCSWHYMFFWWHGFPLSMSCTER